MAAGSHPFPSRTRKLSPPAPMVLGGRPPGRVGRRRISNDEDPRSGGGPLSFSRSFGAQRYDQPPWPAPTLVRRARRGPRGRRAGRPGPSGAEPPARRTGGAEAEGPGRTDRGEAGPAAVGRARPARGSRRLAEDVRSAGTKPPHQGPTGAPRRRPLGARGDRPPRGPRGGRAGATTGRRRAAGPPARPPRAPDRRCRPAPETTLGRVVGRRAAPPRSRRRLRGGQPGLRAGPVPRGPPHAAPARRTTPRARRRPTSCSASPTTAWASGTRPSRSSRPSATLTGSTEQHPVLADCYRALKRWARVDELWEELRAASPSADLVAEGRIVVAGGLADRGRIDRGDRHARAGREDGPKRPKAAPPAPGLRPRRPAGAARATCPAPATSSSGSPATTPIWPTPPRGPPASPEAPPGAPHRRLGSAQHLAAAHPHARRWCTCPCRPRRGCCRSCRGRRRGSSLPAAAVEVVVGLRRRR